MGRPKEFDVEEALSSAMNVFWSQGFKAASLSDLTTSMEISKSSFYETFGSKYDLFLSTIDYYIRTATAQVSGAAHVDAPAHKIIRTLFERAVQRMVDPKSRRGCYLNNCAVEVSLYDELASKRFATGMSIMEEAFLKLVERGKREGAITMAHNSRALARYLFSSLNGILVMGKAQSDKESLYEVVNVTMDALK